ncbi:uncharacterized protein LOC127257348 [Andrographis paniculata]|uniref:uncharacterized protein LOC127257348 n=1 Tax=Andrographis paniculata TaxID=175694 RepID=UPI0021E85CB5|nr:uncharacterized protein LOC127257348 [Andrographis paniculata]
MRDASRWGQVFPEKGQDSCNGPTGKFGRAPQSKGRLHGLSTITHDPFPRIPNACCTLPPVQLRIQPSRRRAQLLAWPFLHQKNQLLPQFLYQLQAIQPHELLHLRGAGQKASLTCRCFKAGTLSACRNWRLSKF